MIGLPAILLVALQIFKRRRRGTADFRASAEFKAKLPSWVKQFETLTFAAFRVGFVFGVAWLFFQVVAPPEAAAHARQGAGGVYFAMGTMLIAIPLAMLCANLLSWLVPAVKTANIRAMRGLPVSFWGANRGLLQFGAASIPTGFALLVLAALAPWGR